MILDQSNCIRNSNFSRRLQFDFAEQRISPLIMTQPIKQQNRSQWEQNQLGLLSAYPKMKKSRGMGWDKFD